MRLNGLGAPDTVIGDPIGSHVCVEEGRYDTHAGLFLGEGGGEDNAECEKPAVPFSHWTAKVDLQLSANLT